MSSNPWHDTLRDPGGSFYPLNDPQSPFEKVLDDTRTTPFTPQGRPNTESGSGGFQVVGPLGSPKMKPGIDTFLEHAGAFAATAAFDMTLGLIGVDDPKIVEKFRQEHPWEAMGASMLGMIAPYSLAMQVGKLGARSIPLARQAYAFLESPAMARAPGLAQAGQTLIELAPFELGRIAGATVFGGEGAVGEVTKSAMLDAGLFGVAGAVSGRLKKGLLFKPSVKREGLLAERFSDYDMNEIPQHKLHQLNTARANPGKNPHPEELIDAIEGTRSDLRTEIAHQDPPPNKAYVRKTAPGGIGASAVNKLFQGGKALGLRVNKLVSSKQTKFTEKDVEDWIKAAAPGVDANKFWAAVQFPRIVQFRGLSDAANFRSRLRNPGKWMRVGGAMGDNTFLAKEASGAYVVVKRLKGRTLQAGEKDVWLLAKTTEPALFEPTANNFGGVLQRNAFYYTGTDRFKNVAKLMRSDSPVQVLYTMGRELSGGPLNRATATKLGQMMRNLVERELGVGSVIGDIRSGGRVARQQLNKILSASLHEFSEDPIAVATMSIARHAYARAQARATAIFFGMAKSTRSPAKTVFAGTGAARQAMRGFGGRVPLNDQIQRLVTDANTTQERLFDQINEAFVTEMTPALASANGFDSRVTNLLRTLDKVWELYEGEFSNLVRALGLPKKDAVLVTKQELATIMGWRGTVRVPLVHTATRGGKTTQIVDFASGANLPEARHEAKVLVDRAKAVGLDLSPDFGAVQYADRSKDIALAKQLNTQTQDFVTVRKAKVDALKAKEIVGLRTRRELKEVLYGSIMGNESALTDRSTQEMLGESVERVARNYPVLGQGLKARLDALAGRPGPLAEKIDRSLDTFLSPVLGPKAASRIVRAGNQAAFTLTLGLGDIGFGMMNALGTLQTILPEVANVMTAVPERLAHAYNFNLVMNPNARKAWTVGTLDPIRFMYRGMKAMGDGATADEKAAFAWGLKEGHTDPRFVEEVFGQSQEAISKMFTGGADVGTGERFLNGLKGLSNWIPEKSEKFARTLSYMTGYQVARDFFRLEGEDAFRWAAEFTARTNFLYGTADRPRILTGALGEFFGLFKNWGFHYMGNMMQYGGEAVVRQNFAPMLWMMGTTGTLGGLGALPLYGMANYASRLFSDDGLMQNMYELGNFGDKKDTRGLDFLFYGVPSLAGISLQGRLAPPGNDFIRDISMMYQSPVAERALALYDMLADGWGFYDATGKNPMTHSPEMRDRFVRAFFPRSTQKWMQWTEDNAMRSLRTQGKISAKFTWSDRVLNALGFPTVDIEKNYDMASELFRDKETVGKLLDTYGEASAEGVLRKDFGTVFDVYRSALLRGVDVGSVGRAMNSQIAKRLSSTIDRQFDPYVVYSTKRTYGFNPWQR